MTSNILSAVLDIVRPAQQIVSSLPHITTREEKIAAFRKAQREAEDKRMAERKAFIEMSSRMCIPVSNLSDMDYRKPATKRTYYLGENGRVSQRPKLVGKIIDLCRAVNTTEAREIFGARCTHPSNWLADQLVGGSWPHIGETDAEKADRITRTHSAFTSFEDMAVHAKGSYRPSLYMKNPALVWLADYYDAFQAKRGDSRVAFRYGQAK